MFFTILIVTIIAVIFLRTFYSKLTFESGRLSRNNVGEKQKRLTTMGEDRFVELSFGKVHYIYRSSSSEKCTLNVFVHGYSTPIRMWQDVFNGLVKEDQPCLAFDLYGRGWSDAPDVPMNIDIFVSQLAELLFALNLPFEKLNLFGVSMGGAIIQRFTELYPSRVSKLVLCCSAGNGDLHLPKILFGLLAIPILGPILFKHKSVNVNVAKERQGWAFPDGEHFNDHQKLYFEAQRDHPGFLRSLFLTLTNFDFRTLKSSIEAIRKLDIPILIIWGDRDTLIPIENAYRFQRDYPKSTLKVIEGATHMLLMEHHQEILPIVTEFISK